MKRVLLSAGFAALGLFATWLALRIVESVDWSGLTYRWPVGRCWEMDHCDIPWYGVTLFPSMLLLPALVHSVAGWRLAATRASVRGLGLSALALLAGTCVFYVAVRLASGAP